MSERKVDRSRTERSARAISRNGASGVTPACGPSGHSGSAPSSRATTTDGTSVCPSVLRGPADRDGDHRRHVLRPLLQHRGDVAGSPHTGGAYSFARSAMGPWGGFLTGLAENAEYVITTAVVGGRSRCSRIDDRRSLRHHRRSVLEQRAVLVGGLLHRVPRDQHQRRRGHVPLHRRHHRGRPMILIVFYVAALVSGKFSPDLWFNIADGGGGARRRRPFLPFGSAASSRRCRSRSGSTWRSRRSARGGGIDGPRRDVPKGTIRGMHTLLLLSIGVLLLNSGWAAEPSRSASRAPRCSTASRRSSATTPAPCCSA